jgi:hypothetical protein
MTPSSIDLNSMRMSKDGPINNINGNNVNSTF